MTKNVAASHCTESQRAVMKRLRAGIDGLKTAVTQLILSEDEQSLLQSVILRNQAALESIRQPYLEDLMRQRAEIARIRKERKLERKLRVEQAHKASGYSDFLRRVPGSFEGSKK
jgi:hypothetical protein